MSLFALILQNISLNVVQTDVFTVGVSVRSTINVIKEIQTVLSRLVTTSLLKASAGHKATAW